MLFTNTPRVLSYLAIGLLITLVVAVVGAVALKCCWPGLSDCG